MKQKNDCLYNVQWRDGTITNLMFLELNSKDRMEVQEKKKKVVILCF